MAEDLDSPNTLTLSPYLGTSPDHQHPPDTASVPATAPPAFPDVAASPTVPDVAASPAVSHVIAKLPEVSAPPTTARKGRGRPKKSLSVEKLAAIQEKLDFLSQNLRPVPFSPCRAPDLGLHERLFRVLGLWDFAHLNLAADPLRLDLLADLIAHYTPSFRSSKVREVGIRISRADLARALALPVKKPVTPTEDELTLFTTEAATTVLTSFVQDWIVGMKAAGVVPREVVLTTDTVKKGHAYKVDWAGLMWTMVEKELQQATKSGQCLYASHLQRLIKHQRPELFKAEVVAVSEPELLVEVAAAVEEDGGNVTPAEEEGDPSAAPLAEQEDQNAAETTTLEDFTDVDVDANGSQLNLGLDFEVDAMLGLEESCNVGVELQGLTSEKDGGCSSHYMQRCSLDDLTAMYCDTFVKEEDHGGGAEDRQFEIKFNGLEQLNSMDLLQVGTNGNVSYNMQHSLGQSSGDFLVTEARTHKNVASGSGPASPFLFGKRDIDEMDAGNEVHPFSQNNPHKRMHSEEQWGGSHGTTSSFTTDFEQMQLWANKIKMDYSETEQEYANVQKQLQYVNDMLQHKDQMIHSLEKARMEEARKRELEASRFEHELRLLTRVVSGYKGTLKETWNVFAEYRKKFPQGEEALYKEVEGGRGLVLSTGEIERLEQLKKEEDTHYAAEVKLLGGRGGEASCSRNDN